MEKTRTKTVFVCQQCGRESPKWQGRCPGCQEWNTLVETLAAPAAARPSLATASTSGAQELSRVKADLSSRIVLPLTELNRVLGGGLVRGALVLLGGDPGIGKSTLLLQAAAAVAAGGGAVVYVSGEESVHQIRLRADRLGIAGDRLHVLPETNLLSVLAHLEGLSPALAIVDSIQTIYLDVASGSAGSIGQIRECTVALMRWAKQANVPALISGHVTKDGSIAGPKVLEHIVDVVLYLEGDALSTYRILRSAKNRFGSTNEVGVFEMCTEGLKEVENPSQAFLSEHEDGAIGASVVPALEGTRPLLVEVQALTSLSAFAPPRRTANGIDFGRLLLVSAVLGKRAGLRLANQDIMVNVVGGLRIEEPAADLALALAIASSFRECPVQPKMAAIGELSLSGELRGVPQMERRLAEAARLGFERCLVPRASARRSLASTGAHVVPAGTLAEALRLGLVKSREASRE